MGTVQEYFSKINTPGFDFKLRGVDFATSYFQAGLIILLLFLLVFALARMRYLYVHWSLGKSAIAMLFWGFMLALILEGFLMISGRTFITEILGWRNLPKPIGTALDLSRERLVDVLGVGDEIPISLAGENLSIYQIIDAFKGLTSLEAEIVRKEICLPGK